MLNKYLWRLFLDDVRDPPLDPDARIADEDHPLGNWIVVRSVAFAIAACQTEIGRPSFVSFDYDLGINSSMPTVNDRHGKQVLNFLPTGYDFAAYLVFSDLNTDSDFLSEDFNWTVHSLMPEGRKIDELLFIYFRVRQYHGLIGRKADKKTMLDRLLPGWYNKDR